MMMKNEMERMLRDYMECLEAAEKSKLTREQYEREILRFFQFKGKAELSKELVIQYKEQLSADYKPASVNAKIAAINSFFEFIGRSDLQLKYLKIQNKPYCSQEKELTREEYMRLLETAYHKKNKRLYYMLQTICSTGIRVSELQFITVEAVETGEAVVSLKGKTRIILITEKLQEVLREYIKKEKIKEGPVFVTRCGNPMERSNIWKMMKRLCKEAGVSEEKVFPHNLRHLFARSFYAADKDIARLADILGHSNINTTRIYIISSGQEHRKRLEALGLVI